MVGDTNSAIKNNPWLAYSFITQELEWLVSEGGMSCAYVSVCQKERKRERKSEREKEGERNKRDHYFIQSKWGRGSSGQ